MTILMRRALAALGTAGFLAVPGKSAAERVVGRSARERPPWLFSAPATGVELAYFVGAKTSAATLESGKEGAAQDAAAQAAAFVRARVSGKLLIKRGPLESRIAEDIRSSSQGRLEGARAAGFYWEKSREGVWPWGKDHWDVWVLVEYPLAQAALERARLESLENEFGSRMDGLCRTLSDFIRRGGRPRRTRIGGFRDSAGQARRPFSRIVEEHLKACLARAGVPVEAVEGAELRVWGEYWRAPGHVEVSAKVTEEGRGAILKAATARVALEAVEPLWLSGDAGDGAEEEFFAAPDLDPGSAAERTGAISIRSKPAGARIFVDGVDRGVTPSDVLGIASGQRSVAVSLDGYVPASEEILVEPEQKSVLRLELRRKTGEMKITSAPDGARVLIDGKKRGSAPLTLRELPVGTYQVALELKNHKPWSQSVEILFEKTTALAPDLIEEDGFIAVIVDPPGARVSLDGEEIGIAEAGKPLRHGPVAAGGHVVSAEKPGWQSREWTVRVRAFQTHSVAGALAAERQNAPWSAREENRLKPHGREKRRERLFSWINRPERMDYWNFVGGAIGGGYSNLRILEGTFYGFSSTLGIGTSLYEAFGTNAKMEKRKIQKTGGGSAVVGHTVASMIAVFPVKVYFVPFAHSYRAFESPFVSSLQFYFTYCPWAGPNTNDMVDTRSEGIPRGSVMDYGILLHAGPVLGLRIGQIQSNVRSYRIGDMAYGGFQDRKFYVATDISLGFFSPGK